LDKTLNPIEQLDFNATHQDILKHLLIIGFAGKNGSGKSTLANRLYHLLPKLDYSLGWQGVQLESFAKRVKDCAITYFNWDGEKDDKGRHLLQWLGTDVGRFYDQDIWIRNMMNSLEYYYLNIWQQYLYENDKYIIIIDDVRFDNEAKWILDNGGFVFQINRTCKTQLANHVSEQGVSPSLITEVLDMDNVFKTPESAAEYLMNMYFKNINFSDSNQAFININTKDNPQCINIEDK